MRSFDLHALSTPQAFILDQDQILLVTSAEKRGTNADKCGKFRVGLRAVCVDLRLHK